MYRLIPVALSFFMMGAHYLRSGAIGLTVMCATAPLALLIKRNWIPKVFSALLCFIAYEWAMTAYKIWGVRAMMGMPATRMLVILAVVALFSAASALMFRTKKMKERYSKKDGGSIPGTVAFFLTFITLYYVSISMPNIKVLLLDRFLVAGGGLEAFWLSIYAGYLADTMQDPLASKRLRPKIWLLFSIVFFLQLILGLFGLNKFLMTGALHIPVPMVIVAGPIFRNAVSWMLIIFAGTIIFVGPAWCSFLCYFGAFDGIASCKKKMPGTMPKWHRTMQIAILAAVIAAALLFRYFGLAPLYAAYVAGAFGVVGIGVIIFWSRKTGVMTHCTSYCPIGFVATILGKINPFRIRIDDNCDSCGECTSYCRYDALSMSDVEKKRPAGSCTLCGDCVSACVNESIGFKFLKLSPKRARAVFIVLVVSLHAIFLGLARV